MSLGIACKGAKQVKQLKPMELEAAREKFYSECGVRIEDLGRIVIDEISFVAARVFGHVDSMLRQLTGNMDVACGGIPLLLCGDNHRTLLLQPRGDDRLGSYHLSPCNVPGKAALACHTQTPFGRRNISWTQQWLQYRPSPCSPHVC